KSDETLLVRKLGKMGSILWAFANGYDESPVKLENTSAPVKSVGNSTTTPRDMETDEDVRIVLYILAESVAARLRENGFRCRTVEISVRDKELFHMWLLRELLNNCIAHSEYTLGGRIYLNEFEDKIILTNPGSFLPGKIEKVLDPGYNPPFYRNQLLAETMVKLNMIDSQSIGIRRVFRIQRDRYFPLPDYDLSNRQQVKVCVYGKVLDENYSQILFANPDFDLETVFLIDCVQKRIKIDKEAVKHLRKLKVIEGMSPNIFLSASVSETIGEQSQYVKNKAFNDQYYRDLIVKYLEQYGSAKKRDVRELLWDKLPEVMDDKQKESKVKNLLAKMRRMGIITTDSENQQKSSWILVKDLNK
ncbi:ATP-binding protein, partial [Agathobacter rectalis]|uniref:ATP-binding protein n=1 Tax=Agathobacter rectalis TaxID=39491 RepID=UPI0034A5C8AA